MIKNIENKKLTIIYENKCVILPKDVREEIDKNWLEFTKENPNLWNGEVTCVSNYFEKNDEIRISCQKTDYAHYLYDERIRLPQKYGCVNISGGCLLETSDGYYLIGELDKKMSYPYMLQVSGGNVDKKDVENGFVDIMKTISREVMEEININLYDQNQVYNLKLKYMYEIEKNDRAGVQIFSKANLKMNANEMKNYYNTYLKYLKENNLEVEFGTIHFIKKDNAVEILSKMDNPKRDYLLSLVKFDMENYK